MHAQENDSDVRGFGGNLSRRLNPIQDGHRDIHYGDIWLVFLDQRDTTAAVSGIGHNLKIGYAFQQQAKTLPDDGVIVGKNNSGSLHAATRASGSFTLRLVPWPGCELSVNVPPRCPTLSSIPSRP